MTGDEILLTYLLKRKDLANIRMKSVLSQCCHDIYNGLIEGWMLSCAVIPPPHTMDTAGLEQKMIDGKFRDVTRRIANSYNSPFKCSAGTK